MYTIHRVDSLKHIIWREAVCLVDVETKCGTRTRALFTAQTISARSFWLHNFRDAQASVLVLWPSAIISHWNARIVFTFGPHSNLKWNVQILCRCAQNLSSPLSVAWCAQSLTSVRQLLSNNLIRVPFGTVPHHLIVRIVRLWNFEIKWFPFFALFDARRSTNEVNYYLAVRRATASKNFPK